MFWAALIFGPALLASACATVPEPEVTSSDLRTIQQRVEDVERTNGRLMVRVEEMERQVALMQDRVETNRIALQRRGYLRQRGDEFAVATPTPPQERPAQAPQSNFPHQGSYQADPTMQQRIEQRGVARIPLSDHQSGAQQHDDFIRAEAVRDEEPAEPQAPEREIVITNETLESYFGPSSSPASRPAPAPSPGSSTSEGTSQGRRAHPPVTSERLRTSAELEAATPQPSASQSSSAPRSHRELLELYQDSLALYRAGTYGDALKGFYEFLNAGPRPNYVDNALYWIGECHYGLGDYERSVRYFQRILDELPRADKVPDAMLKMSLAYDRMDQGQRAYDLLKVLVERYPRSNPGRLGEERIVNHPLHEGN